MRPDENSVCAEAPGTDAARNTAENLLGELCALLRQVGSPEFSPNPAVPFWASTVDALPALRHFLEVYLNRFLLACELPAIVEACGHTRRGEWRELLAQDLRMAEEIQATPFAEPSRRMGGLQLARLRPLRDERTLQRYLAAVESGHAHGWHTMVYGVTLAVYSWPLRQGLLYYSQETLSALASAAGRSKSFGESELDQMLSGLLARVPAAVEAALPGGELISPVSKAVETGG
jgi:urease accessory protein UreF